MKRLKLLLQSNSFYLILLIILIIYVFVNITFLKIKIDNNRNQETFIGKVILKNNKNIIIKNEEKILVKYKGNKKISLGDIISIESIVFIPQNNTITNTFNYKKYLFYNKINKIIYANEITIFKKNKNILIRFKDAIIDKATQDKYLSLFILGDKSYLEKDIYNNYKNIGVAHILAISGMHINVLIGILNFLFKYINKNKRNILIIIILYIYLYLTSFVPSVFKVFIFHILKIINKKYFLQINKLKLLFICFFIMTIINPFYLFNIGVLFSFLSSLAIIMSKKFHSKNAFLNILIITFFINLFILPITININYEINLILFISNLILIPLISFFIYPFSLLTFVFPFLIKIFNLFTLTMEKIVFLINKITFLKITFPKMGISIILLYYLILVLFIYYDNKALFISLIGIVLSYKALYYIDSNFYSIYLDVGQGDSSLMIFPYKKNVILIDTGGNINNYISERIILYLKSIGINKLDYLILSHGDFDHMGEAINLVNNFKIDKVIFNCGEFNDLEKELIKVLDKKNIKYYSCIKGLNIDNNKLYVLNIREYGVENDNSIVIYTKLNNYKFLFMGDAGIEVEKDIVDKYNLSDIDFLKVGHHGSYTSSNEEFINKITPKHSIISVGKNNRFGHPNEDVLNTLKDSKIYRTDQEGSIEIKLNKNGYKIRICPP